MTLNIYASSSSGNAYRISDGKTSLLLDAGLSIKALREAMGFEISGIDGCLITHEHKDHSEGARDILRLGVDTYTSSGTAKLCGLSGYRVHIVKALKQLNIGTFTVLPFDVEHDAEEPLGFLIYSRETKEKLLYFTDTHYLKYKFSGLTHIMGECNYSMELLKKKRRAGKINDFVAARVMHSHMSLETFIEFLKATDTDKLQAVYLLHLSESNSDEKLFRKEVEKVAGSAKIYIC